MMKRMGFSETIFLFFLALIIFGPKKLPEIARQVGKAMNEFRRASNEFKAQLESEISQLEVENHQQILPPSEAPKGAVATMPLTLESAGTPNPALAAGFEPGSEKPASESHAMAKAPNA
jgi:sec-independent protein translocase protein TatB